MNIIIIPNIRWVLLEWIAEMNLIISRRYYHKRRPLWLSLTAIWAVIAVVLFSIICPSASSWKDFILILFPVFGAMVNFTSAFGTYLTVHKSGVKIKDLNYRLSLFIPWQYTECADKVDIRGKSYPYGFVFQYPILMLENRNEKLPEYLSQKALAMSLFLNIKEWEEINRIQKTYCGVQRHQG